MNFLFIVLEIVMDFLDCGFLNFLVFKFISFRLVVFFSVIGWMVFGSMIWDFVWFRIFDEKVFWILFRFFDESLSRIFWI